MGHDSAKTGKYVGNELEVFALAKNWKSYWVSFIKPLLGNRVLEVGAGVGSNLLLLHSKQELWLALEPDAQQCEQIKSHVQGKNVTVMVGKLDDLPVGAKYDSIVYIDVLEHIEEDTAEVERALGLLSDNGKLIVLSPAHQSLYSPFDEAVGHFRRYNKASLAATAPRNANIEQLYYLDSVGFLASWVNAKILRSDMPTTKQVWIWDTLMVPLSRFIDPLLRYGVGKTVVMVLSNGVQSSRPLSRKSPVSHP